MPYIGAGIQRFNTADGLTVNGDAEVTGTVNPSGDTASGDAAAVGFTSAEGLILTGQGSTSDITLKNDADAVVFSVPTGTDDILFPDNAKAIFGAGSDLELSHNGTNSIIEGKTGDLIIRTAGTESIFLQDAGGNSLAQFNDNSDVKLYHNANEKLATTASGVSITGQLFTNVIGRSDDTNTTIDFPGSDLIQLFTSGSERMRLEADGRIYFQKTAENAQSDGFEFHPNAGIVSTGSAAVVGVFNRKTNDGTIVQFRQDNTTEGTITVSGSTVSYNGGHLARWSQATDGNRIDGLVKGTVMTNLDQMAEWTKDGVTEDNEQLNCMAVSSVEGDANVAGVFVRWDEDDEDYTNDMVVAMTGDMVIRIAKDTTVARGNLLMSAGDGTAKPQGDGYVQDKTIAKVTSTTKSHTYDDGSYLVPCVLMAC